MFRALHEQEQTPPDEADASEGTVLAADAGATSEPTADVPSLGLSGNGERAPALMNLAPGASFTATLGNHTTQARRLFVHTSPPPSINLGARPRRLDTSSPASAKPSTSSAASLASHHAWLTSPPPHGGASRQTGHLLCEGL